ncbi:uncharacterized protein LOC114536720 [Dendronephthya gigantea]|uniref:uncharacterized protein LOC114536720 n=1 Tax=Dendronephthya gigantea TaxID=151771 RepID=UPI00106935DB|nr:uncharacterized protein LOC114536720 [Dendronephthya gigantea]
MERLRFVLRGGTWGKDHSLQASECIKNLAKEPKLQQFLDNIPKKESMEDKAIYHPGCLRKGNYDKGKLQTKPLSECLEQVAIEAAGLPYDTEVTSFKAVLSERQTLINSGSAIVYVDDQHQHHLGIFKKGIKIKNPDQEVVAVEEVRFAKDELENQIFGAFQCPKVELTGQVKLLSPQCVIEQVCLIHDCSAGRCCYKESQTTVTVEREAVSKATYKFVHNTIIVTTW